MWTVFVLLDGNPTQFMNNPFSFNVFLNLVEAFLFLLFYMLKKLDFLLYKVVNEIAGLQLGSEEHRKKDPPNKMLIAIIIGCCSLGAIICSLFCFWIYYWKNSHKFTTNDAKNSGNFF